MKKILSIIIFVAVTICSFAQPYGNEWINYDQKYLKFKVVKNGIYKIDYNALTSGFSKINESVAALNPKNIQLFANGEEIYIHVEGESDNDFDAGDYIEFYAEKNTGWLDSLIYDTPASQNNPYYSLFNDTATYYLTWNNSISNRRMIPYDDVSFTTPASNYFMKEIIDMGAAIYAGGWYNDVPKYDVSYTETEGYYYSSLGSIGATKTINFNTQNFYSGSGVPNAIIKTVAAGINNPDGNLDHHLLIDYQGNGSSINVVDYQFSDFELIKRNFSILPSELSSTNTSIIYKNGTGGNANSKIGVSNTVIKFPHTYNLENASSYLMWIPSNSLKTYLDISNFSSNTTSYIHDLTGHYRIKTIQSAGNIDANVPPGVEKKCFITTDNSINSIFSLSPVTASGQFRNFLGENPDSAFIAITHPLLYASVKLYNGYRKSTPGGLHDTITANVNELYDQFAYGIGKHPMSIRNFCAYLIDNLTTEPQYLFLVGKSIKAAHFNFNSETFVNYSRNVTHYRNNLVPTFGVPPSDLLFTQGLSGNYYEPAISVGRLAAKNATEVNLYLSKVKSLELEQYKASDPTNLYFHDYTNDAVNGLVNKEWMKHVAHFGGGADASQQNLLKTYLNVYKSTVEKDYFGAKVHTVSKSSSAVIEPNLADTIKGWVENGLSLITFFGHSSAQGFDVSLDDPQFYSNKNKYPLFIANGCFSGDIHNPIITNDLPSTSESFILIENAGAIGFISTADQGYEGLLHTYTKTLYEKIAKDNYGTSIGFCMKECARQMIQNNNTPESYAYRDVILSMTLHGDPAVKVNSHPLADYYIDKNTIFFTPEEVTSDLATFDINIVTYNLGKAVTDDVMIYVERTYEGGVDTTIINAGSIFYKDTTTITYPMDQNSTGLNQFRIFVDWNESISTGLVKEISETNNSINFPSVDLWIGSDELIPIYPYNFAVVPDTNITLKASTAMLFAEEKSYKIQIDTTDTYNSVNSGPIDETIITQSGGVVRWKPNIKKYVSDEDSTVFFWRTQPVNDDKWREHSFQYVKGKTGWSQDHFFQFKNDNFSYINYNRNARKIELIDVIKQVYCKTSRNTANDDLWGVLYRVDGVLYDFGAPCGSPAMAVVVIDPVTLIPWQVYDPVYNPDSPHSYGNWNNNGTPCGRGRADNYFLFRPSSATEMNNMVNMLTTVVPDGYYILVYTLKSGNFQTYWNATHFQTFIDMGADSVSLVNLGNDFPYIFFTQKGDVTKTEEVRGKGIETNEEIILNAPIISLANWGLIESPLIGPAYRWDSLHWNFHGIDAGTQDSIFVNVFGQDWDGVETKLKPYFIDEEHVRLTDDVDASKYPYIYLQSYLRDDLKKTALQLDKWQVIYEEIPEAALNPTIQYSINSDTLYAGQDLELSIAVENVSMSNMDSLRISYKIIDQYGNSSIIKDNYNAPLLAGNVLVDSISYQVLGNFSGNNKLYIEVNPIDSLWQLEQYHFNNTAEISFNVNKDLSNPLMDVTFDGVHILNGDIVSSVPEIIIELKDENPYLALNDTSDFFLYLTDPNGNTDKIPFMDNSGQEILLFEKGELPENKAKILWNPTFEVDGVYKLSVQARDVSNNLAGDHPYNISFEVVNRSTITHLLNYPNPFTTKTQFVFTLTGSVVPDVFKIQILTVTGKVVREITKEELGDIHIGRNITPYAWDGTDEFGDFIANGVYLYRVITKIQGETIEHRQSGADEFFVKDFGKMYIMR